MTIKNADLSVRALLEIDRNIDQLVKEVELLSYVNPVNIKRRKNVFSDPNT